MPHPSKKRPLSSLTSRISPPPSATTTSSVTVTTKKVKIKSTTTKNAMVNFFKPASQKAPEPTTWRIIGGTLLVGRYRPPGSLVAEEEEGRRKVAGFDLDGTLIKTLSGTTHARTASDWTFWTPLIPSRLLSLHQAGYRIAIFSNQAGLKSPKKDTANLQKFKQKVAAVLTALDLPITVYAATEKDWYRKPQRGMWDAMLGELKGEVDLEESWLVGDAAGRKGDFSDSDRMWAVGVGIVFFTPEEFFLGRKKDEKIVDTGASSCDEGDDDEEEGEDKKAKEKEQKEEEAEKEGGNCGTQQ